MKLANCLVTTGTADDEGGGLAGPAYGVWYEDTDEFQWLGGQAQGVTSSFHVGAQNNRRPTIVDIPAGMLTLPLSPPREDPVDGMAYFDTATDRLFVRSGARWRSVKLD